MTLHDTARHIAEDASAQRLLNLFFIFNTATRPLSTEEIVSDSDLGYGSAKGTTQRESDVRKFRRDRQKLAEQGIHIVEANPLGAAETEESYWKLDRAHTFAAGGVVTADDAETLAHAIDEYLSHTATPLARPLQSVRNKALELAGKTPSEQHKRQSNSTDEQYAVPQALLDAIWTAFATRQKLTLSYTNAQGEPSKRTVAIYGIFTHEGVTYITGLDSATETVRTFRADRIAKAWRPSGSYRIPPDFDVRDRVFLPFDFGDEPAFVATFSLPGGTTEAQVQGITRGRGSCTTASDGSFTWNVTVHDSHAAASFALAHAREGLRPRAPQALVDAWNNTIDRAVIAHGA